jgi:hypothetical protein
MKSERSQKQCVAFTACCTLWCTDVLIISCFSECLSWPTKLIFLVHYKRGHPAAWNSCPSSFTWTFCDCLVALLGLEETEETSERTWSWTGCCMPSAIVCLHSGVTDTAVPCFFSSSL